MSGSRFPWLPVLVLAAATAWAAAGGGAAPSRDSARGWDPPTVLAQVVPPEGSEGGNDAEDEEFDPSDTLDVQEDEPLTPDTTQAAPPPPSPADTAGFVPSTMDTSGAPAAADTNAAGLDTLRGTFVPVTPDSATAAKRAAAAADSGVGDTLFTPKPGPQAPAQAPPKKPRSGILGIHPIVILLGLVALHYFVTKTTGD